MYVINHLFLFPLFFSWSEHYLMFVVLSMRCTLYLNIMYTNTIYSGKMDKESNCLKMHIVLLLKTK